VRTRVDLQRVCLAPAAIQREHELRGEALAPRMRGDERLQLADQPAVLAEPQLGIDSRLERSKAQLLQPPDLSQRELLVRDVRQRPAAPHPERLAQDLPRALRVTGLQRAAPLLGARLEDIGIDVARRDLEQVAPSDGPQHGTTIDEVSVERSAQSHDRHLQALERPLRPEVSPQRVDQLVAGHRAIGVEQQQRQERNLTRSPDRDPALTVTEPNRAEDRVPDHFPLTEVLRSAQPDRCGPSAPPAVAGDERLFGRRSPSPRGQSPLVVVTVLRAPALLPRGNRV